ncbi:leucyl-tRNA synthetase [Candidatus Methylomirabilis lanthanidiphila]|uniref:Leucine--tRNA ligase n=1 Tax=Candidatus Methylomirabilis lanthanidiphila TaxID=2211376 RepID=A0A564ZFN0_9BACT|nr:leucine--tRNA ligase [Candidatus Methylomirabilis lanthanidiphila]VUZ83946.1 leucyl-tRNA synthetase [Candidatus Methylomirabilis lanthanidiphila]
MARGYDFKAIEVKWQRAWEESGAFAVTEEAGRRKFYLLEMYPYPSGRIHMGHVRNYAIGDVLARFLRMRGYNVLHPMGWDSFGLPAENAAIEHRTHPAKWTNDNIAYMRTQLKRMGFSYDWQREIACSSPDYYRWGQWLFLRLYEKGLAYKKSSTVNWCEVCQTVLANEQVEGGLCWRDGTPVVQKELPGWFFRITAYAEELLNGLDSLTGWPEPVKMMQRNWIGKSVGAEVRFPLVDRQEALTIFTTRQDTLFGATFMVLAPEHPRALALAQGTPQEPSVSAFIERVTREDRLRRTATDAVKEGVFTGAYAMNPLTHERIPVWIGNFVLPEYGTGAIMAVPSNDQRDFEFAQKYSLPVRLAVKPVDSVLDERNLEQAYEGEGVLVNSGPFTSMDSRQAREAIADFLEREGIGKRTVNYRLRDWGISRQRYWGNPIPIIYCDGCGTVPVPDRDLPVILPQDVQITMKGGSPLQKVAGFIDVSCPRCGGRARRETDTMDTFVDSSWYFLRFTSPNDEDGPVTRARVNYWMPVDQYIGGIEHAVLHLLYARFFTKAIRDLGLIAVDEPFQRLLTQGMVCKETHRCAEHGFRLPEEVDSSYCCRTCGHPVQVGRTEKMSKSKKNVVDPEDLLAQYGADTARLFCLFAAPPERDLEWSAQGVEGSFRFVCRIVRLVEDQEALLKEPVVSIPFQQLNAGRALCRKVHQTVKRVTEDIEDDFHFNTAISALMELANELGRFQMPGPAEDAEERRFIYSYAVETLLLLLSPFAPHLCEELWERLGRGGSIFQATWPAYDPAVITAEEIVVVVQIDGKVRSRLLIPVEVDDTSIREAALADERIKGWLEGRSIRKVVIVPKKLVNIVTGGAQ